MAKKTKRHPLRSFLAGLCLGASLATGYWLARPSMPAIAGEWREIRLAPNGSRETQWAKALAAHVGGVTEFRVENGALRGRVDVLTPEVAIEVDWLAKWHQGVGQAHHYGYATGRRPVVALIVKNEGDAAKLPPIADVCRKANVELWVLRRERAPGPLFF